MVFPTSGSCEPWQRWGKVAGLQAGIVYRAWQRVVLATQGREHALILFWLHVAKTHEVQGTVPPCPLRPHLWAPGFWKELRVHMSQTVYLPGLCVYSYWAALASHLPWLSPSARWVAKAIQGGGIESEEGRKRINSTCCQWSQEVPQLVCRRFWLGQKRRGEPSWRVCWELRGCLDIEGGAEDNTSLQGMRPYLSIWFN